VITSSGSAVYGQTVTFTATVTAPGGTPAGMVTFSDGGTVLGTAALDGSGHATLTTSSLAVGADAITASYGGDANLMSATSAPTTAVSVAKAGSQVVLVPMAVAGKKNEVSLEAEIEPLAPGAGVPTGTVTFEVRKNKKHELTLGTLVLGRGEAAMVVKSKKVHRKSITIAYGGDADFQASTLTMPITPVSPIPTGRPMVRLSMQR
jgi:Bacterial Ig-like domain (group 3)